MVLDPAEAARVEAAFDAAQLRTRAPIVCVLAHASVSREAEFLLGACILALAAPLPLLLFTELSAHRIYVAQLLVAILAGVLGSLPPVRRRLTPKRAARSAGHRAALAQFTFARARPLPMRRAHLCVAGRALHPHRSGRGRGAAKSPPMSGRPRSTKRLGRSPPARPRLRSRAWPPAAATFSLAPSRRQSLRSGRSGNGSISFERGG